jgi:hypothetical protein
MNKTELNQIGNILVKNIDLVIVYCSYFNAAHRQKQSFPLEVVSITIFLNKPFYVRVNLSARIAWVNIDNYLCLRSLETSILMFETLSLFKQLLGSTLELDMLISGCSEHYVCEANKSHQLQTTVKRAIFKYSPGSSSDIQNSYHVFLEERILTLKLISLGKI